MKKSKTFLVCAMLSGSVLFSSCIGSFGLWNSLKDWNQGVSNKFVNELVFFCFWILPVYEVTGLADILVLNSIEFWSGSNPVAQGRSVIDGADGRYLVDCDGKGYTITSENDGSVVRLDFDAEDNSWSASANGSEPVKFMTFVDETHVEMLTPDGGAQLVELSEQGMMAYRETVASSAAAAMYACN